jgi:hypothetical protein
VRRPYEQGLGADLAPVRVHTDARADDLNRRLGSTAFTTGHHLFFRRGEFDPASEPGREVLAHELVHVVQQTGTGAGDAEGDAGLVQRARTKKTAVKRKTRPAGGPTRKRRRTFADHGGESDDESADPTWGGPATKRRRKVTRSRSASTPPSTSGSEPAEIEPAEKEPAEAGDTDIPVDYLDLDAMKRLLSREGLRTDQAPQPVSVGVVVWNLNHLKADDDADDAGPDTDDADLELDDVETDVPKAQTDTDAEIDLDAEPEIDLDAEPEPEPEPEVEATTYDTKAISQAIADLKAALAKVAEAVDAAADAVIAALDQEPKSPARSDTRKEVSQLKRDLHEIRELDLDEVLGPGIEALSARAKGGSTATIGEQAAQLDALRALNRVWKRLVRLQGVLYKGTPRSGRKVAAREAIRAPLEQQAEADEMSDERDEAVVSARQGIETAITTLLTSIRFADLQSAVNALKRGAVIELATMTFFRNPAVSIVLTNEMNLGIKHLARATERTQGRLGLSKGPIMLARGQLLGEGAKSTAGLATGSGEGQQQVGGRQYEYYSAVHRPGGEHGVELVGTFYVHTDGRFAVQEQTHDGRPGRNNAIPWNKAEKTFRGIVVHCYIQNGQELWTGIIHTTPAGKDLDRTKIWPQISTPLASLNELARHFQVPLLVGGDFYIPAEGIVNTLPAKSEARKEVLLSAEGRQQLGLIKATNFARNIFLAAAADDDPKTLERFVDSVKQEPPAKPKRVRKAKAPAKKGKAKAAGKTGGRRRAGPAKARPMVPSFPPLVGIRKPQMLKSWARYRRAVRPRIRTLAKSTRPSLAEALRLLAGGAAYNVSWSHVLGAGIIGENDIVRNYRRPEGSTATHPEPRLTMARALEPLGYRIVAAGSPTNPKERGRGENKMQLADLFLVNEHWQTARSGIVTPSQGQLKPMDDAELSATRTYWKISDHSPVLLLASSQPYDLGPFRSFDVAPTAEDEAVGVNQAVWDHVARSLDGLDAGRTSVADQVAAIKKLLAQPLVGPTRDVEDEVRALVRALGRNVELGANEELIDEQAAMLAYLEAWDHPWYTVDMSEQKPSEPLVGPLGSGTAALATTATTTMTPPHRGAPHGRGLGGRGLGGGGLGGGGGQAPNWPTGQIVNVDNSCYLSAIIHVLADQQAFRDALTSNAALHVANQKGLGLRNQGGLRDLVAQLQRPAVTISAADMQSYMRYLDQLGGLLVAPEPAPSGDAKAKQQAVQVTRAKEAYGHQQDAAEVLGHLLDLLEAPATTRVGLTSELRQPPVGPHQVGTLVSSTPESHPVLMVPLVPGITSITAALRRYSETETVKAGYPLTDHHKQILFTTLPDVLTIALGRFRRDAYGVTHKLTGTVTPEDPLVIPDQCLAANLVGQKRTYRLHHVVHHRGRTPSSGHYRSYGKLPGTDTWYEHDDTGWPDRRTVLATRDARDALDTGYIYVYVKVP